MRPLISIRGYVRRSVRQSVGPSVGPFVTLSWKVEKWRNYTVQGEITAHITSSLAYCRILSGGFSRCPNSFNTLLLRISEYWYVFIRIGLNYLLHFIHLLGVLCILYLITTGIIHGYVWWVDLTSMKYPYACFSLPVFVATLVILMLFLYEKRFLVCNHQFSSRNP